MLLRDRPSTYRGSGNRLYIAKVAGFAAIYVATARLGLGLDAVGGFATLVWPPTGISLALLLLYGIRLWPGVMLGALVANLWVGAPLPAAAGIATGNTLEAIVGCYALRGIGFRPELERVRDVLGLILLAAVASTTVSATVGVASLLGSGLVTSADLGRTWQAWWLGDMIGDLVVAPVLLTWLGGRPFPSRNPRRHWESTVLASYLLATTALVFGSRAASRSSLGPAYLYFPPLVWATLRFGQRGAVAATLLASTMAVAATAWGYGPFAMPKLSEGLFLLQGFITATAATFLMLGALASERNRAIDDVKAANEELERQVAQRTMSLRSANARFDDLLELAPDGLVIVNQEGKIVLVNALAERLFGYARAELVGQSIELLVPGHLRTAHARHRLDYTNDPRVRPMGAGLELFARRKDGSDFPVEISLSPLATEEGTLVASAIRDITDRKLAEENRVLLAQEHAARAAAEETVRQRDEFISIASHELRTPLTPLLLNLDMLARQIDAGSDGSLAGKVEVGRRQVQRLIRLVDGLLDVSQMATGRIQLMREELDLSELARDFVTRFQDEAKRQGCELRLEAPKSLIGHWDRHRLEHVFSNLLSNALKYGPGKPIEVSVAQRDGGARLSVRDHGIGIEPKHMQRIFGRFERAVPARSYGGLGLGLYISQQAVEVHGGRIWVESAPGEGSTFVVELPLRPRERPT